MFPQLPSGSQVLPDRELFIRTHGCKLSLQTKLYPSPFWEEQEGMMARAWGHTELQYGQALELPTPDHPILCSAMTPDGMLLTGRRTHRAMKPGHWRLTTGFTSDPRSTGYRLWGRGKFLGPSIPPFNPCMIGIISMPAYRNVVIHISHPGYFFSRCGTRWAGCVHLKVTEWNSCFLFSEKITLFWE